MSTGWPGDHVAVEPAGGVGEHHDPDSRPRSAVRTPWATVARRIPLVEVRPPAQHERGLLTDPDRASHVAVTGHLRRREPRQAAERHIGHDLTELVGGGRPPRPRAPRRRRGTRPPCGQRGTRAASSARAKGSDCSGAMARTVVDQRPTSNQAERRSPGPAPRRGRRPRRGPTAPIATRAMLANRKSAMRRAPHLDRDRELGRSRLRQPVGGSLLEPTDEIAGHLLGCSRCGDSSPPAAPATPDPRRGCPPTAASRRVSSRWASGPRMLAAAPEPDSS